MANKKISQLVAKTTIQSTDLFPIGDATTGTLYKKTIADLQAAIGGAVISVNGLVGTVVLDADDILETATPTNKYFTDARARAAISLTTTGSSGSATYSSSTGVLNVPTYTLTGLGGITATFLSGGTGISYNSGTGVISYSGTVYTDSSVRGLFSATAPLSYNSTTGAFTISQATTSTDGYLSSTDWNTFNGKQNALTNPVTGTGTSGYVTFWNGSGTVTGDAAHFWDNTNKRLGIGTNTPSDRFNVVVASNGNNIRLDGPTSGFIIQTNASSVDLISYGGTTPAYRALNFSTGASTNVTITTAGNVGISTTSPNSNLQIGSQTASSTTNPSNMSLGATYGTTLSNGMKVKLFDTGSTVHGIGVNAGNVYIATLDGSTDITINTNSTERIRINSSGNCGIGTASPTFVSGYTTLSVNNTSAGGIFETMSNGTAQGRFFGNTTTVGVGSTAAVPFIFTTSDTERMRLTTSANLLIGTTTDNGERLYVSGAIRATGTITANSDITLKKNLAKIENALEKVEQINGYTYEFKEDDSKRHAGVIAQEIQGVLPEIVNKGNDGILGVEYGNISALLIEAIKEQQAQINELKALLNK